MESKLRYTNKCIFVYKSFEVFSAFETFRNSNALKNHLHLEITYFKHDLLNLQI